MTQRHFGNVKSASRRGEAGEPRIRYPAGSERRRGEIYMKCTRGKIALWRHAASFSCWLSRCTSQASISKRAGNVRGKKTWYESGIRRWAGGERSPRHAPQHLAPGVAVQGAGPQPAVWRRGQGGAEGGRLEWLRALRDIAPFLISFYGATAILCYLPSPGRNEPAW